MMLIKRLYLTPTAGVLALLHLYIGWRLLSDLHAGVLAGFIFIAFLTASFALIPLGFFAHAIRRQPLSDRLAWAGLSALGSFSSLFVLTFLRDVLLLLGTLIGQVSPDWDFWTAAAVPCLVLLVTGLGFFNARRRARVVHVDVPIDGLSRDLHGFTIAQISDIHVGPTIKQPYIEKIVQAVNALQADVVAITGDLVDGSVQQLAPHTAPLAGLSARHGAFFVTGNHDYYSGAHGWIAEVRRLGIRVLLNEHVVLRHDGAALVLAGVTDYTAHHFDPTHRSDPQRAIAGAPADAPKILLAHQPRTAPAAADAGFDLQISGHTHGGQFFPWNFFVPLQQPYVAGLKRLRNLWIYVSRGTGYWGPPKRFGAPSEITRIRLIPA